MRPARVVFLLLLANSLIMLWISVRYRALVTVWETWDLREEAVELPGVDPR